jgi:hypothetical protein
LRSRHIPQLRDTNYNTALGDDALFSLTSGADNTAIDFDALASKQGPAP